MKTALLIVDMQNIFMHDLMKELKVAEACEYINHVAGLLRSKGHLVVHIQDMEGAGGDADPAVREVIPEITVDPQDIRVMKQYSNAFWQTDLEQLLRSQNVGFVIVAGFAVEHCVTFTYNGALERDFQAAMLQKSVLSTRPEATAALYHDRHLISYPVVEFLLNK
ncbi:isochorismatase [Paenibacillus sp. PK3_47]|uniref:cysteine hydrolase family protein n=1 Tax=Paenibacillus sp. PK3_47 TaxID=2072642 RepID=UPI00201E628B|nr:isochorismatase family protein [Paenibacillus sp. PK3_47]UQZ32862.1 isochorismatase [Paenibacillus sp. PK3_47]